MKKFIGVLLFLGMTPPLMAMDAPELSIRPSSERWRESAEKIDEYSYRYKNISPKNMNVHDFNKAMEWPKILPTLIKIDQEVLGSDEELSCHVVEQKIKNSDPYQKMVEKDQQDFDHAFGKLLIHLSQNVIEKDETQTDVQKLLWRVWHLSDQFGFLPNFWLIHSRESAIEHLLTGIKSNITENGGCYAGYSGRLALNYLMLLEARFSLLYCEQE